MEERVASLQARVDELENPQITSHSVLLQDPYSSSGPGTSGGVYGHSIDSSATYETVAQWWNLAEPPSSVIDIL